MNAPTLAEIPPLHQAEHPERAAFFMVSSWYRRLDGSVHLWRTRHALTLAGANRIRDSRLLVQGIRNPALVTVTRCEVVDSCEVTP